MKKITGKQLAEFLNVSPATVSNVLNGRYERVSEATKNRVWTAAEELGFTAIQRSLQKKAYDARTIAFVAITDHTNEWFLGNLQGIADICRKRRYLLSQVLFPVWDPDYFKFVFANLQASGILLITSINHPIIDQMRVLGIPYVSIDSYDESTCFNTVHLDNFQGAYSATNYLLELGHRKIGLLGGATEWASAVYREQGYIAALKKYGLAIDPKLKCNGAFTDFSGYISTKVLLDKNPSMTAIFAASDEMALGALRAISESNLRVPEDISIIGFDGSRASQLSNQPLTTVETDPFSVGSNACEMLIGMLESQTNQVAKVVMDAKLSLRKTTGPPGNRTR